MLRRPPTRAVHSLFPSERTSQATPVNDIVDQHESGEARKEQMPRDFNHASTPPVCIEDEPAPNTVMINGFTGPEGELPSFLFDEEPVEFEPMHAPEPERWNEPFASGIALSDRVMRYGGRVPTSPDRFRPGGLSRRIVR